jgi:hypothetical protein
VSTRRTSSLQTRLFSVKSQGWTLGCWQNPYDLFINSHSEQNRIHKKTIRFILGLRAFLHVVPNFPMTFVNWVMAYFPYNESPKVIASPKVVTPIAPVCSMRSASLLQLPGENLGLFHRFEMPKSVKLINSALDVRPASFFASGDQIPLGREKHGDPNNLANFMTCQTVIVSSSPCCLRIFSYLPLKSQKRIQSLFSQPGSCRLVSRAGKKTSVIERWKSSAVAEAGYLTSIMRSM